MKIRQVECEQFAGMKGESLTFGDGLNLVIGENESGKSTLAELIFQLLFKDSKLDRRKDSDFLRCYFPKKTSGISGDVIDGTLEFETGEGIFRLKREWEPGEGSARLTLPDGTLLKNASGISEILKKELNGRAGLYGEIVFATQKRSAMAVRSIMEALTAKTGGLKETREDLLSALTKASLETGGVSIDKLEKALQERLESLSSRWDEKADLPEGGMKRGILNEWKQNVGEILAAYYAAEHVRKRRNDTEAAERAVEKIKAERRKLNEKKQEAERERNAFQRFRGMLEQRELLLQSERELEESIREETAVLSSWPKLRADREKTMSLQKKLSEAEIRSAYRKAEDARKAWEEKDKEFRALPETDPADIKELRNAAAEKAAAEGRLSGLSLEAVIQPEEEGISYQVISAASGEEIGEEDGRYRITEAASIRVPGVMEVRLMPRGIDVEEEKKKMTAAKDRIEEIYERYDIQSPEELEALSENFRETGQELERLRILMENSLADQTWEELRAAFERLPEEAEPEEEIREELKELCGERTAEALLGALEQTLQVYAERHISEEKLKEKIKEKKEQLEKNRKKQENIREIPEEYEKVQDPDQYDLALEEKIRSCSEELLMLEDKQRDAERGLGDKSAEEYSEELKEKEAVLQERKEEYRHWKHIFEVFRELKETTAGNPAEDLERSFRSYLEILSDGGVSLDSMDEEMSASLSGADHALTYETLSEGTKDTVALAFRLAMLEQMYPEGGGLAVFDDPFTDMDPERTEKACRLVRKFAESNQVIFFTCDDKYEKMFPGKELRLSRQGGLGGSIEGQ